MDAEDSGGPSRSRSCPSTSAALDVRPADPDIGRRQPVGGNQQKVLLARWLLAGPKVLIADEPTRGVDVGAKADVQRRSRSCRQSGLSVIFISSELEEVLRLAQRVVVMQGPASGSASSTRARSTSTTLIDVIANEGEGSAA